MNIILRNKVFSVLATAFRTASVNGLSAYALTMLALKGFDSDLTYRLTSILQVISILTMFLFSRFADKGNVMRRSGFLLLANGVIYLFYLPFCGLKTTATIVFILYGIVTCVETVISHINTVCEYKIPYYIYRPNEYAPVSSLSGIVAAVISFILSSTVSSVTGKFEYGNIMLVLFSLSFLFMSSAGVLYLNLKPLGKEEGAQELEVKKDVKKVPLLEILKHPSFTRLFVPNFLRGVVNGFFVIITILALDLGYHESIPIRAVAIGSIASFSGSAVFTFLSRRIPIKKLILAGSFTFLLLPLILLKNNLIFLIVYALAVFGRIFVTYGIPALLLKIVPVEMAGPYNTFRMILLTAGSAVASILASLLSPAIFVILITVSQLVVGISYFFSKGLNQSSSCLE